MAPWSLSLVISEMGGGYDSCSPPLGGLEDNRRYCVKGCSDGRTSWAKERSPVCGAGRECPGPLGTRCRKGSDKMSIGARPATGSGDASALLPRALPKDALLVTDWHWARSQEEGLYRPGLQGHGLCIHWSNRTLLCVWAAGMGKSMSPVSPAPLGPVFSWDLPGA